jgi:hypothetical protein
MGGCAFGVDDSRLLIAAKLADYALANLLTWWLGLLPWVSPN